MQTHMETKGAIQKVRMHAKISRLLTPSPAVVLRMLWPTPPLRTYALALHRTVYSMQKVYLHIDIWR